jgi:anti-anti-sigma factor
MTNVAARRETLRCDAQVDGKHAVLRLVGRLDMDTVWSFGAELAGLIRDGRKHITVDFAQLDDVSALCVGVLNRTVSELKGLHGSLSLCGVDDAMVRRLRSAGLHPAVLTPGPYELN